MERHAATSGFSPTPSPIAVISGASAAGKGTTFGRQHISSPLCNLVCCDPIGWQSILSRPECICIMYTKLHLHVSLRWLLIPYGMTVTRRGARTEAALIWMERMLKFTINKHLICTFTKSILTWHRQFLPEHSPFPWYMPALSDWHQISFQLHYRKHLLCVQKYRTYGSLIFW